MTRIVCPFETKRWAIAFIKEYNMLNTYLKNNSYLIVSPTHNVNNVEMYYLREIFINVYNNISIFTHVIII